MKWKQINDLSAVGTNLPPAILPATQGTAVLQDLIPVDFSVLECIFVFPNGCELVMVWTLDGWLQPAKEGKPAGKARASLLLVSATGQKSDVKIPHRFSDRSYILGQNNPEIKGEFLSGECCL